MNKTVALKLIAFSRTPFGQRILYKVKNDYPSLWANSFTNIRQKVVFSLQGNTSVMEADPAIRKATCTWENFHESLNKKNSQSACRKSRGIQIFTPDFPLGIHTITELAVAQAAWLSDFVNTKVLRAPYKIPERNLSISNLHFEDNPRESNGASIFHLGNNTHSTLILHELILSNSDQSIVILHDLNLISLFDSYGNFKGIPNLIWKLAEEKYGSFGVINLRKVVSGEQIPLDIRGLIFGVYLELICKLSNNVICHDASKLTLNALPNEISSKLTIMELPTRYVQTFVEEDSKMVETTYKNLIIISGTNSSGKNIFIVLKALLLCLADIPSIRIRVIGSIRLSVERAMLENLEFRELISVTEYFNAEKNSDWISLHQKNALGIRLNVGLNGESSGLIRDYLMFGMKVISDESTASLQKHPKFFHISKDCSADSLAKMIVKALKREESEKEESDKSDSHVSYLDFLRSIIEEDFQIL